MKKGDYVQTTFTKKTWIAGVQWFFFIFANIIIIPITISAAFDLSSAKTISIIQMSFIVTGLASLAQGLIGHRKPILEGQSGLWWGIYLTLVSIAAAQGTPLNVLGGSIAAGVIISGFITMLIGLIGAGPIIAQWFNSAVMGVFMLLLGMTLVQIFLKGMLGIPFGNEGKDIIQLPVAALSLVLVFIVIIISIKSSEKIRSFAILIGMLLGWLLYVILFGPAEKIQNEGFQIVLFPLGKLNWDFGIIITLIIAGILNFSNTFVAIKGAAEMYKEKVNNRSYLLSFQITGIASIFAGLFGLVPYAPYVSALGFLRQTNIYERLPFLIGSILFFLLGVIPPVGAFFATMPLSVGSAVLFVAYLQFFGTAVTYFKEINLNALNIYRVAIPAFVGMIIMTFPAHYFESIPLMIRPFLSNGLLVGVLLALLLENTITWEKIK